MDSTPEHRSSQPCAFYRQSGQRRQPRKSAPVRQTPAGGRLRGHMAPKPRLELQGSDSYLKKPWRLIAKGELGYIPAKHIVSPLPEDPHTRGSRCTAGIGRMGTPCRSLAT